MMGSLGFRAPTLAAAALLLVLGVGPAGASTTRLLRSLSIHRSPNPTPAESEDGVGSRQPELWIEFNRALQYRHHSPERRGQSVLIQLVPLDRDDGDHAPELRRESLSVPATSDFPGVEVTLQGEAEGTQALQILFPEPVDFTIRQGRRFDRIVVALAGEAGDSAGRTPAGRLLIEANQAMTDGQIDRAILLYTSLLALPENRHTREATELLGVARERNGQQAQAAAQYRRYLEAYPDDEATDRVRQRLGALMTSSRPERKPLRRARSQRDGNDFDVYGSLSTYYTRVDFIGGDDPRAIGSSQLVNLYLATRLVTERLQMRSLFSGTYRYDFVDGDTGDGSRIDTLELDLAQRQGGLSARVGRMARTGGGILGRVDGASLGYAITDNWEVAAIGGLPVRRFGKGGFDTDRWLVGAQTRFSRLGDNFDGELYGVFQQADELIDRAAIGATVRYLGDAHTAVAYLDYDALFNSLNLARLLGNWRVTDRLHLDLLAEYRNSPFLTTTNALIGSGFDSITDLPGSLSDDEVRDLARSHTAQVTTVSLGGMFRLTDRYSVTGSFSASDYSGTAANGYDDASGFDFSFLAQLVASGLLQDGDVNSLGFRVLDAEATNIYSVYLDTRYTLYRRLRFNPRLRIDYRSGGSLADQVAIRPGARLEYRWESLTFDFEFTYEWNRATTDLLDGDRQLYLLDLGVRYDF